MLKKTNMDNLLFCAVNKLNDTFWGGGVILGDVFEIVFGA